MFLLSLATALAADVAVTPPYPVVDAAWRRYFPVGGELVAVKGGDRGVAVQRFDLAGPVARDGHLDDLPSGHRVEAVESFRGRVHMLTTQWSASARVERVHVRTWDPASGRFSAPTVLFETPKLRGHDLVGQAVAVKEDVSPRLRLSPASDGSALLVTWRPGQKEDEPARVGVAVLEPDMRLRWKTEATISAELETLLEWDEAIDAAGDAWLLGGTRERGLEDGWDSPLSKRAFAWRIRHDATAAEALPVDAGPGIRVRTARLAEVRGAMRVVGITSGREGADGIFSGKIADGALTGVTCPGSSSTR